MRQGDVARWLDVSQSTLSNYEGGLRHVPIEVLVSAARLYDKRLSDIVSEEDAP